MIAATGAKNAPVWPNRREAISHDAPAATAPSSSVGASVRRRSTRARNPTRERSAATSKTSRERTMHPPPYPGGPASRRGHPVTGAVWWPVGEGDAPSTPTRDGLRRHTPRHVPCASPPWRKRRGLALSKSRPVLWSGRDLVKGSSGGRERASSEGLRQAGVERPSRP